MQTRAEIIVKGEVQREGYRDDRLLVWTSPGCPRGRAAGTLYNRAHRRSNAVGTVTVPDNVPVGTEYWEYHASDGGWIQIPIGSDDGDPVITSRL